MIVDADLCVFFVVKFAVDVNLKWHSGRLINEFSGTISVQSSNVTRHTPNEKGCSKWALVAPAARQTKPDTSLENRFDLGIWNFSAGARNLSGWLGQIDCFATNRTYQTGTHGDFDRAWNVRETKLRIEAVRSRCWAALTVAIIARLPIAKRIR